MTNQQAQLSIFRFLRKLICNECFNALPTDQTGGRGARPVGWAPPDAEKGKCATCGREGILAEPSEKESG